MHLSEIVCDVHLGQEWATLMRTGRATGITQKAVF